MLFEIALLTGAALVAGYFLFDGGRRLRTVYHILQNDPLDVRSVNGHSGPVEIEGTAVPDDDHGTITAPFSGAECLACSYEVQELRSSGKHSSWQTLDEGQGGVDFLVDDGTGRVRVDPHGSDIRLDGDTLSVSPGTVLPDRLANYVESTEEVDKQDGTMDLLVTEVNTGNKQRFIERRLDVGETVYVYGQATRGPSAGWGSDLVDAVIGDGKAVPVFVVSDTDERGTAWRFARGGIWRAALGIGILAIAAAVLMPTLLGGL
jgi:hypothetical protein